MDRISEIEDLFRSGKLKGFAITLCRDESEAEDLVSDVVKKLLERASEINDDIHLEAYAITAIKNRFIDKVRGNRRQENVQNLDGGDDFFNRLPDDLAEPGVISPILLEQTIRNLDEKCRDLLLNFAIGNSYQELANSMRLKIGTVTSRMARCRQELAAELGI